MSGTARRTWWNAATARYTLGELLSQSGTYVSSTAQAWVVLSATQNTLALGIFMALRYGPAALVTPWIGALVDGRNPRRVLQLSNILQMVFALAAGALALTPGALAFWPFVLVGACSQVLAVAEYASRTSYLTALVSDEHRAQFVGATTSASSMGRVVGPAVAGALLSVAPSGLCFAVDAVTFALSFLLLPHGHYRAETPRRASLRESFRVVWHLPLVRDLLVLFALVSLVSFNVATLMPLFVRDTYLNDPKVLALLNATFGIGSVAGGLVRATIRVPPEITTVCGLVLFGVAFAAAGIGVPLWAVGALLFLAGFGRVVFAASSNAMLVTGVEEGRRGFVGSLYAFAFTGVTPVGALLVSSLSSTIGAGTTISAVGGFAALAAGAYALRLVRGYRKASPSPVEPPQRIEMTTAPCHPHIASQASRSVDTMTIDDTIRFVRERALTRSMRPGKLETVQRIARGVEESHVPGIFVETGVALGGSAIVLAKTKTPGRELRLYDSYDLIPAPGENDDQMSHDDYSKLSAQKADQPAVTNCLAHTTDMLEQVKINFRQAGIDVERENVHFVKGLFYDTLIMDGPVAFAHVDCDWYDPVAVCIERLRDHISCGGVVMFDDYSTNGGAKRAVDSWLAEDNRFEVIHHDRSLVVRRR
ncbi:MFS transporter [Streptomyces orinoci]|uniref:MFS transporter n=1 Tax=Streptomyces orinoci TaxID=67339 RepID=A0ABV3JUW4_STRON|nr:MFS transporter [Streptomyces orinoci]